MDWRTKDTHTPESDKSSRQSQYRTRCSSTGSWGADIVEKQKNAKWGDGFLKQLSQDLSAEFPEMKGFSLRNIERIRKWYITYKDVFPFATQLVPQIEDSSKTTQPVPQSFFLYSLGASHPYYAAMQGCEHGFVLHPTDH